MERWWLVIGSVSAFISVGAGAFGAHVLKQRVSQELLAVFETAARYEMYHALALLAVGLLSLRWPSTACTVAGWSFVVGTLLFSGSLYVLALSGVRWLGAITPVGGVAFLVGWMALTAAGWRAAAPP